MQLPKILFPSIGNLEIVPPVINVINCLSSGMAEVTVFSYDLNKESFHKKVETIPISSRPYPNSFFKRILAKIKAYIVFYIYLIGNARKFDLIWISTWEYRFVDLIARSLGFRGQIVFHFHELELSRLKYCRKADFCVVPEENRLWIAFFLGKLKRKPLLLPNIPFVANFDFEDIPIEFNKLKKEGKKILLYQGLIDFRKRCLKELLLAMKDVEDEVVLVVMPMPSTKTLLLEQLEGEIKDLDLAQRVFILNPKTPPFHLNYVKYADVGIGLYRPTALNQVYAAPNRLFEFTKYSVPLVLPDFPAFKSLGIRYEHGIVAVNPESAVEISRAINKMFIPENLLIGKRSAGIFFKENANYEQRVQDLLNSIIKIK